MNPRLSQTSELYHAQAAVGHPAGPAPSRIAELSLFHDYKFAVGNPSPPIAMPSKAPAASAVLPSRVHVGTYRSLRLAHWSSMRGSLTIDDHHPGLHFIST